MIKLVSMMVYRYKGPLSWRHWNVSADAKFDQFMKQLQSSFENSESSYWAMPYMQLAVRLFGRSSYSMGKSYYCNDYCNLTVSIDRQ